MPNYTFTDGNSEEFTLSMKIAEFEQYIVDNPQLNQVFGAVAIGDPVRLGITKPDAAFSKHVLGRIKEANTPHGGPIGERHFSIPREY